MKLVQFAAISIALMLLNNSEIQAQTLFTVGNKEVSTDEFLYVYRKNKDIGNQIDPKTAKEYLELYVQFKRKVLEAERKGRDTLTSFETEFNNYYRQLLKPYLTDKKIDDQIINEAFDRMKIDVRASHIMLDLPEGSSPSDTLKVFKQILALKNRLVKGENFEILASQESSDSYSAKNAGDLSFFTVFNMVYAFENACYNAEVGELVGPVRTQYGYHLIKVTDKRPSRYRMTAAHILLLDPEDQPQENAEVRIREIHDRLSSGEPFNALALKFSQDQSSVSNGGKLPDFGLNQMLPEFEDAVFKLQVDGSFSMPFRTKLGWHIVQRLKKHEVPDFDRVKSEITLKIRRDERSNASRISFITKLKKRYGLAVFDENLSSVVKAVKKGKKTSKMKKIVFSFDGLNKTVNCNQSKFAEVFNGRFQNASDISSYSVLESMIESALISEAEVRLPIENKEFRFLAQEYREGILVFDLTREKVWDAASNDSILLAEYFKTNQNNYQWQNRRTGTFYYTTSSKIAKKADVMLRRGIPGEKVLRVLNAKDPLAISAQDFLKLEAASKKENSKQDLFSSIKDSELNSGVAMLAYEDGYALVHITENNLAGPKQLSECKGQVIADLQDYLDGKWNEELLRLFPLSWNQEEWKTIESKL
ncbi:MAG: Chaperone SurA [Owenweeksia sp. TMED14]|nr:MAG: Chaperone SurA [Owenweeksia sp. TMED14]